MLKLELRLFRSYLKMSSALKKVQSLESSDFADSDESLSIGRRDFAKNVRDFIPKLTPNLHKGQCGRIGVIGGSFEYTGAPYFAAISALYLGADLVHVFCCREAGSVIKSYSPELIVHPFLDSENVVKEIEPWLERLHALVIGPGMGRNIELLANVEQIIIHCNQKMKQPLPLIIDADGLFLVTENINIIKNYNGPLILTPNGAEFLRLSDKMGEKDPLKIASALNAVVLQKGSVDIITNGIYYNKLKFQDEGLTIMCDSPGSNRRCGGQGDVLSGCIATFVAWLQIYFNTKSETVFNFSYTGDEKEPEVKKEIFKNTFLKYSEAVYCACLITRTCSKLSFESKGRGMTASDLVSNIFKAFKLYFDE